MNACFSKPVYHLVVSLVVSVACSANGDVSTSAARNISHSYPVYLDASQNDIASSRRNAITRAVEVCSPAVVGINVTEIREHVYQQYDPWEDMWSHPLFDQFFRRPERRTFKRKYEVRGLGSGFLVSPDGYIVTNEHVARNASSVVITMTDGEKYDAEIIGTDRTTDIALLKIKGKNFPFLRLANSNDVAVGEWAIAFGNPFGLFDINSHPTVTVGVVSNTNINFTQADGNATPRVYRGMIQTDAAISSGNSGGPLVNALGEVIGVNTVIYSTSQNARGAGSIGIGFAIPINRIKSIIDKFIAGEKLNRNFWTGFSVRSVDESEISTLGLKRHEGILVERILNNSPADNAGLEPGDVILEVDGIPILREDHLYVAIYDAVVGQVLPIKVLRNGKERNLSLTLKAAKSPRENR